MTEVHLHFFITFFVLPLLCVLVRACVRACLCLCVHMNMCLYVEVREQLAEIYLL